MNETPQSTEPQAAPTIDVKRLLKYFGGRSALCASLTERGNKITLQGIDKWRERGAIPSARLLQLMALAESQGRSFNIQRYIVKAPQP